MFTVLRAFLPSEQAWAFQWLFNTVFPQLLGKKTLSDVKLMVTDRDAQETSQLDIDSDVFGMLLIVLGNQS